MNTRTAPYAHTVGGPLGAVRDVTDSERRRRKDPAPWDTGTGTGPQGRAVQARNHEEEHRANRKTIIVSRRALPAPVRRHRHRH